MAYTSRVIILVDMDCFYCQVEEKLNPYLQGKPIAVVQYNTWKGGGIIAVNYPARDKGVTRHMRGNEAKEKCPEIELVQVPAIRGKADLRKYRDAGKQVAEVLQTFTPLLERASVDEAYLDITETVDKILNFKNAITLDKLPNTHIVGSKIEDFLCIVNRGECFVEDNLKLAVGAIIAEEIRAAVFEKTGYKCSAGIAHNKILAKLACGLNKPNKQTILPQDSVQEFYTTLPVKKIKSLGGKFGVTLSNELGIKNMIDLLQFSKKQLIQQFDVKTGTWLYNIARGIDLEPVTTRLISKSVGSCKKFPGKAALLDSESIIHWINELVSEIVERLEKDMEENNRKAKQIIITFAQEIKKKDVSSSRTHILNAYDTRKIANDVFDVIKKYCRKSDGSFCVKFLGIIASKFEDCKNVNNITSFFKSANMDNRSTQNLSYIEENFTNIENIKCIEQKTLESHEKSKILEIDNQNEDDMHIIIGPDNSDKLDKKYPTTDYCFNIEGNINKDGTFSDETEEEFYDDVFYYDDSRRIKQNSFYGTTDINTNVQQNENDSDTDSISNEVNEKRDKLGSSYINHIPEYDKNSFFKQYLINSDDRIKSPICRTFNTSAILEEHLNSDDSRDHDSQKFANISGESLITDNKCASIYQERNIKNEHNLIASASYKIHENDQPSSSKDVFVFENSFDHCHVCHTRISKSEFVSHMDYHFALKLAEEDKFISNKTKPQTLKSKFQTKSFQKQKMSKRKSVQAEKTNLTLMSFLTSSVPVATNEPVEICCECNKSIALSNFASHVDYHAARKLHMEINSSKAVMPTTVKTNSKSKKVTKNINVLSSYFKIN